jgi:hypothetical protein
LPKDVHQLGILRQALPLLQAADVGKTGWPAVADLLVNDNWV